MYKKIMVPLDGSELSECVLPHMEAIVKGCNAPTVVFLRVVETMHSFVSDDGGPAFSEEDVKRLDLQAKTAAKNYLDRLVGRIKWDWVKLQTEVIVGRAAESLAEYAEKNGVDLVVIATHGRSGVSRWVWGSVADRILRSVCVPVLMVRAPGCVPGI